MKINLFYLTILLAVATTLTTCKHKCEDEYVAGCNGCDYDQSIEGMKEWYYFKTGTWWVYQEETSGELDTITVYDDWEGITGGGYDGFLWDAISSYDGYKYLHEFSSSFSIHCLNEENCTCHKLRRDKSTPGNYVGGDRMFAYPIIQDNYLNMISNQITAAISIVESIDTNYTILGSTYYSTCTWGLDLDPSEHDKSTKYVFAKNVGIVKREIIDDGKSWLLKEYHIVQ